MSKNNLRGRGRAAASVVATMALFGGAAAVTAGPARSAEPAGDCTAAFPVAELADGDAVTGLTVSRGTTPEEFTGEILGVIKDGIAPGLDMVMAELNSAAIQAAAPDTQGGTIWAGMSGSPVYAEDGRLIGAVAYGLSWGPSNIAGITPFEEMDNYLPDAPASRVAVTDSKARQIARESSVSREQAAEGFSRLRIQQRVSGLTQDRVRELQDRKKFTKNTYLSKKFAGIGGTMADPGPGAETVVAGGNLAVSMSYGDITQGGVGTATSICDGGVVGFGHPATFLGTTTLSMHPASAIFVQPESLGAAFKVANFGDPVGTISGDHLSGVSGMFGALPQTTTVTSALTYQDRDRTGSSFVSVPESSASVTFYQQLANHDRVLDGIFAGSELLTWEITGDDNGTPFSIGMTDRYASSYDIAFESPWDAADAVWYLSQLEGVTVEDVLVDGAVDDDSSTWRVRTLEQRRDGEWVKVSRRKAAVVQAGRSLKLRALLAGTTGQQVVRLDLAVPAKAAGQRGGLVVSGGAWTWNGGSVNSVEDLQKRISNTVRNDAVQAQLWIEGRRRQLTRTAVTDPTEKVVYGQKWIRVKVR